MYLIGLTGNIATGKSTVRRMLEQLGARVIDADGLVHAVLLPGTSAWRQVVDAFGFDILQDDGTVDRQKLGAIVFADPARLRTLEAITHPAVAAELGLLLREARDEIVVVEAVKLIEAGLHRYCDAVWIITTTPAEALRRLVEDRNMSPEEAEMRLAAQPPLEPKLKLAQVIIDNSESIEATRIEVVRAFASIDPEQARDKKGLVSELLGLAPAPPPASTAPAETQAAPAVQPTVEPSPVKPETRAAQPAARQESPATTPPPTAAPTRAKAQAAPTRQGEGPARAAEAPSASPASQAPVRASASSQAAPPPARPTEAEPAQKARELTGKVSVRRARPGDFSLLGRVLAGPDSQGKPLPRDEIIKRFGKWGYWIAEAEGQVLGLLTWRAENLVAIVRDLWTQSPALAPQIYPPLFAAIETEAQSLVCEVIAIITTRANDEPARPAILASGYAIRPLESLHPVWRDVTEGERQDGDMVYIKQLRERIVTTPF